MTQAPAFFYSDTDFRAQYPAFANATAYPPATLQQYFNTAGLFIANTNYGFLSCAGATLPGLYMLTAHLAQLGTQIANGQQGGITVQATIDKISVGLQQVPLKNQWQYWLASTPYGAQLLAMLQAQSTGGFYQPGGFGRCGFSV